MSSYLRCMLPIALLTACGGGGGAGGGSSSPPDPGITDPVAVAARVVTVRVIDDSGQVVPDAEVVAGGQTVLTNGAGVATLSGLTGPALAVVSAPGHLSEPVPIGRNDDEAIARLWDDAGGRRWSYHAGGDVMLARRYLEPSSGTPRLRAGSVADDARELVAELAPLFRASTVRSLNLESVVSDLPPEAAYPRKRFLLNTPVAALAGIEALQPDVVVLANNHIRDYLDAGVSATLQALADAGLTQVGAATDDQTADTPVVREIAGLRVGFYALTTVNGDFVNDSYPVDEDPVPANLGPDEAWQYEFRSWGFRGPNINVPERERRAGSAWRRFSITEEGLPEDERAEPWASLVSVYPELQDWVARRGHGGAAYQTLSRAAERVAEIAADTDLLIVNLHAGFQFQESPSDFLLRLSRDLIDAGADLVVAHHPHVLQGAEFYRDGLIVYSLGNLVFDQDFLATFASALLRVVYDGTELLEARFLPVEIDDYRPVPATDEAARLTLERLWDRSVIGARSERIDPFTVRSVLRSAPPEASRAQLRIDGHTGVLLRNESPRIELTALVPAQATVPLPFEGLVDMDLSDPGEPDLDIGRDLFGWGHFEDVTADGLSGAGTHFVLSSADEKVVVGEAQTGLAHGGERFLRLRRGANSRSSVLARARARVTFTRHRIFQETETGFEPADGEPEYSLHLWARLSAPGRAEVRADLFNFFDADPTEDPESVPLNTLSWELPLEPGAGWTEIRLDIPTAALENGGLRANAALVSFSLDRSSDAEVLLDIDDYSFIEWRLADAQPNARFGKFHFLRNRGSADLTVSFDALPPP